MIKLSVKKPFTILVAVVAVLMLAAVSLTKMTTDLLPEISTPYMVVVTTYPGASPEKVELEVTQPLEDALSGVNGVKNVTSSSAENYCMIMLEFQDDTHMDSALVKVNTAIDTVEDSLPDLCSTPSILELSMDMMATMYVAVSHSDMDIYQLTDYMNDEAVSWFQRQEGVASVSPMGLVEELVEIRLDQGKIDALNEKLIAQVQKRLDEARQQLDDAQAEIDKGLAQLESGEDQLNDAQNTTAGELGELTKQMNEALATQAAYTAILTSLQANQTALQTELQAYQDAGVVDSYNQINAMFAQLQDSSGGTDTFTQLYETVYTQALISSVQSACDQAGLGITVDETNVDAALAQLDTAAALAARAEAAVTAMVALGQVASAASGLPTSIEDALANPEKLEAARDMLQSAGQSEAAAMLTEENLRQLSNIVTVRIPQIEGELANLDVEIMANRMALDGVTAAVQAALDNYAAMEAGKISAAAGFGSALAQLQQGRTALEEAQAQLDAAAKEYETAREAALENANLNGLLTLDTLSALIYAQNFSMPAGYIDDKEDKQWLIKVGEELQTPDDLRDMVLTAVDGIGDITVGDVAEVVVLDNAQDSYSRINGQPAVLLSIYKSSTASTSAVSKTCNEAIVQLMEREPGLAVTVLMDQGEYIELFINSILGNIVVGALLAILVLAVFLRSVKPTLVVAFSIPFSVLVAVLIMYFSGITLNIMSMAGLALGIGMLVDNSIVVIENIYRLRGRGLSAPRASVQGAKQVAGAIISSTLTTVCVFLPIIFTSGMVRQLMVPFALTITYALLASLIVALTVVPCMGSVLLRNDQPKHTQLFQKVLGGYEKSLNFCLKRKWVPLTLACALLAFCIVAVTRMGIVVIPAMNSDQVMATVVMDEDLTLEECYAKADEATHRMLTVEGVDQVGVMTNMGNMLGLSLGGNDHYNYTYYLVLDESVDKVSEVEALQTELEAALADLERCTVTVAASGSMDLSALTSMGLSITVSGDDSATLRQVSEEVMALVEEVEGFTEVSNGTEEADQVIQVNVDKDKAMRLGLTVAQIYGEIAGRLTTSATAATITRDGVQMDVVIVDETDPLTVENLLQLELTATVMDEEGNQVTELHTLDEVATVEYTDALSSISRSNGTHTMTVTAATEAGYNTARLAQLVQDKLDSHQWPQGYSVTIGGEAQQVTDMLSQMVLLMALGCVLVYLVMVAQFQSLLSPFIILFTIPLAFTGGLIGLLLFGEQLSMISLLGFTVLMGTVVNNGIVFVDYVNQLRLGGLEKHDALVASGKTRMRPILMTTLTTVLAMSTMMFSRDITASMSRGMAVVVGGGLTYATLMTLYIVPVMYDILYRKKPTVVDVGDDLDQVPDDAAEYLEQLRQNEE